MTVYMHLSGAGINEAINKAARYTRGHMDAAFDRLTGVQKLSVNKHMFCVAYDCVVRSQGSQDALVHIVRGETDNCRHLESDLMRYCRLVQRVM